MLSIRMFGTLDIHDGVNRLGPFATYKSRSLFSYLVLHQHRAHARNVLAGTFWGERPDRDSRKCLRTELWRIRQVLSPNKDRESLTALDDQIQFAAPQDCWIDVVQFEAAISPLQPRAGSELTSSEARQLREAITLYRGHLLEEIYDDWCLYVRERLRLMHFNALTQLLQYNMEHSQWAAAIECGERLLNNDPLLESVHRHLMRCHYLMGNRARALQQFAACERCLDDELSVGPMRDTVNLADRIRSESEPLGMNDPPPHGAARSHALIVS